MIRRLTCAAVIASVFGAFGLTGCDTSAGKSAVTNSAPAKNTETPGSNNALTPPPLQGGNGPPPLPGK